MVSLVADIAIFWWCSPRHNIQESIRKIKHTPLTSIVLFLLLFCRFPFWILRFFYHFIFCVYVSCFQFLRCLFLPFSIYCSFLFIFLSHSFTAVLISFLCSFWVSSSCPFFLERYRRCATNNSILIRNWIRPSSELPCLDKNLLLSPITLVTFPFCHYSRQSLRFCRRFTQATRTSLQRPSCIIAMTSTEKSFPKEPTAKHFLTRGRFTGTDSSFRTTVVSRTSCSSLQRILCSQKAVSVFQKVYLFWNLTSKI